MLQVHVVELCEGQLDEPQLPEEATAQFLLQAPPVALWEGQLVPQLAEGLNPPHYVPHDAHVDTV